MNRYINSSLRAAHSYSNDIIVNEYPKSGGTWLSQLIGEIVDIPFPRNKYPPLERCILHGHYKSNFMRKNIVTLWRDGRDISVSFYYHCLIPNGIGNQALINHVSRYLNFKDPGDIQNNLPDFLELMFSNKSRHVFSWPKYVDYWLSKNNVIFTHYEKLLDSPEEELRKILHLLGYSNIARSTLLHAIDKYSFSKQSGRNPGNENPSSFLRKGVAGDWVNYFSSESSEIFNHYAGKQLILLGYENDSSWV